MYSDTIRNDMKMIINKHYESYRLRGYKLQGCVEVGGCGFPFPLSVGLEHKMERNTYDFRFRPKNDHFTLLCLVDRVFTDSIGRI
jgi:hypothetical protein